MSRRLKYIKSFLTFIGISVGSILGVMLFYKGTVDFSRVSLASIAIAGAVSILSLYLETERVRIIGWTMNQKVPFKASLESVMGREFLSAITPFGGGGQPMGVYILNKYGIKLGQAISFSYLETFYTLFILFLMGIVSLFFYHHLLASDILKGFLVWSFGAMIYFFFFSYFSISKPKMLKKIGFYFINFFSKLKIIKPHLICAIKYRIIREIKLFHRHIRQSLKSHWFWLFMVFFSTLVFWILRFVAVFPIVLAMGYQISIVDLVAYQMIITSVNYFSITPGSSGTTDWLGAVLFGTFIAGKDIPTFITLWRFFSYHLIVLICGAVIFRVVHLFSKKADPEESEEG